MLFQNQIAASAAAPSLAVVKQEPLGAILNRIHGATWNDTTVNSVTSENPGHLSISFTPSPVFSLRNQSDWLDQLWKTLREIVLAEIELFCESFPIRGSFNGRPEDIEIFARQLRSRSAFTVHRCQIDLRLADTQKHGAIYLVEGNATRIRDRFDEVQRQLSSVQGGVADLYVRDIQHQLRRHTFEQRVINNRHLRRPRWMGENDDPEAKLLRVFLDLRSVQWWMNDCKDTNIPEDAQAVVATPRGPFVMNAVPFMNWGEHFNLARGQAVAIVSGWLCVRGQPAQRRRVGLAIISPPFATQHSAPATEALRERFSADMGLLAEAFDIGPETAPSVISRQIVAPTIHGAQEALIAALRRSHTDAVFVVRRSHHLPLCLVRGADLDPEEHRIPLKRPGSRMNHEQLFRVLRGLRPLPASQMRVALGS